MRVEYRRLHHRHIATGSFYEAVFFQDNLVGASFGFAAGGNGTGVAYEGSAKLRVL
jgi:hypothetical protein